MKTTSPGDDQEGKRSTWIKVEGPALVMAAFEPWKSETLTIDGFHVHEPTRNVTDEWVLDLHLTCTKKEVE